MMTAYALPMLGQPDFNTPNGRYRAQIRGLREHIVFEGGRVSHAVGWGVIWSGEVYDTRAEAIAAALREADPLPANMLF